MRDLIKENATYKLFLVELLESFEMSKKKTNDKELKKYFIVLIREIKDILGIKENNSIPIHEIFKGDSNETIEP